MGARTSPHGLGNRVARVAWGLVQGSLFRWSPRIAHRWRNLLLRAFGADVHPTARVYPRARIWGPWNLTMGPYATIADDVDCYCVAKVTLGERAIVSQYSYLCGATHDFERPSRPLTPKPITIGAGAWVAADVFVAPGVTIGQDTVVGARSSVFSDLPARSVCFGTPARVIRERVIRDEHADGEGGGA
ncbi:MAG: putative colanic acid biosynthesis acetyltransferase [Planctomycetota bacterium]|nr:MAG: putative colanic acid biosynthesis acetyltransferase [Planctomycetota bacterium]